MMVTVLACLLIILSTLNDGNSAGLSTDHLIHAGPDMYNAICNCSFFVGNKMIVNVDRFSHLGHI